MKTEKRPGQFRRFRLILLIPMVTFLFVVASQGKTINPTTQGGDATTLQQDPQPVKKDIPFVQVDEMPVYPGGDAEILKYIAEKTVYPEAAKKNNITGKVIVRFIVEKDCSVSEPTILQSVNPELDAESIRVVKTLKFEKPAKNAGVAVRCYYMLPITFALK
jgi:protein TonB